MKRSALLVVLAAAPAAAQQNLVLNPGFEDATGGQPDHWTLRDSFWDDIELSSENPADGAGHIRATGFITDSVSNVSLSQQIGGIVAGTPYSLGLEYNKGDFLIPGSEPTVPLSWFAPFGWAFLNWLDVNNSPMTPPGILGSFNTVDDPFNVYLHYQSGVVVAPAGAVSASLEIRLFGGNESYGVYSILDVDNVSFAAIPSPGAPAALLGVGLVASRRRR